ncbi:MAG: penicillin-binding protein 1C [Planctomycetes bacterium]|nr:penicillin-binding protein 1C [Planctomycetota bacterium]
MRWKRVLVRAVLAGALLAALPALALQVASLLVPLPALDARGGALVFDRSGTLLWAERAPSDAMSFPVPLARISPWLARSAIAIEDERFHEHGGVDGLAALRALRDNLFAGRRVSGASTLEMQVARLCGGIDRSFGGKFLQAATALALARHHDKRAILEAWLNHASFGGDVVGCEAASLRWFGKHAFDLELHEAALLAGLPQSPERLRPDRHPEAARARRDRVLARLRELEWIDAEAEIRARSLPLGLTEDRWPRHAPHAARRALRERGADETSIALALDAALQRRVEETLESLRGEVRAHGASSVAVLIVENASAEVRAHCGSLAPLAASSGQQVDVGSARRSPGSTLKPFLYALALEQGLCGADELLADRPRRYGAYLPQNFDGRFGAHGERVPLGEALARSLNAPAIELLDRVGVASFAALLVRCGLSEDARALEGHGLALALGTCELRLRDLVAAYAMLGRGGVHLPLRMRRDEPLLAPQRVLDPAAVEIVRAALSDPRWSPLAERGAHARRFAVKTGTSSGGRDAWCLATTTTWTIGVWVGNPGGAGSAELSGRAVAAPLLARLIEHLPPASEPPESLAFPRLPALDRTLALPRRSGGPRLLTPHEGAIYAAAREERTGTAALPVRFEALFEEDGQLRWWLDGRPREGRERAWVESLEPGWHHVRVADELGRASEAHFHVLPPRSRQERPGGASPFGAFSTPAVAPGLGSSAPEEQHADPTSSRFQPPWTLR